jgi:hypothetical protein
MTSFSRRRYEALRPVRHRCLAGRLGILLVSIFAATVFVGAAYAVNFYWNTNLGPGGYATTAGWNNRDYNRACADPSGVGWDFAASVGYYDTNMVRVNYSGIVGTNCGLGHIARLENDGYFRARCWNNDTVYEKWVCQTTP